MDESKGGEEKKDDEDDQIDEDAKADDDEKQEVDADMLSDGDHKACVKCRHTMNKDRKANFVSTCEQLHGTDEAAKDARDACIASAKLQACQAVCSSSGPQTTLLEANKVSQEAEANDSEDDEDDEIDEDAEADDDEKDETDVDMLGD